MNKKKDCAEADNAASTLKRTKYNVKKDTQDRTYEGIVFDSAVEMRYYRDVVLPKLNNGDILCCERQKRYILQPAYIHNGKNVLPIEYKADFYIVEPNGKETVIDIKGCPDSIALLKRKMFWYLYPNIEYIWLVYVKKFGGWIEYDKCKQLRRQQKKKLKENKEDEK